MQLIIDTTQEINWAVKGSARIAQNVANLLKTRKYEVSYDRTLGLTGNFIDKPLDQAIAEVTAEIYDLISSREPRASLVEVLYVGVDKEGNMQLKVVVDI